MGHANVFVQETPEYNANCIALEKRLLPAVLAATTANGSLLANYLLQHAKRANGLVDASVEKMYAAIFALHQSRLIEWEISPIRTTLEKARAAREKEVRAEKAKQDAAIATAQSQEANEIMAEVAAIIRNFSRHPHSRTASGKERLRAEVDKQLAGKSLTVELAQTILKSIQDLERALP